MYDYRYVLYEPRYSSTRFHPIEPDSYLPFELIISAFNDWLTKHVKSYLDDLKEPDLWNQFSKESNIIDDIKFEDQSDFSNDEKQKVIMSINSLKLLIHTELNTSAEQQAIVIEKLDYLTSSLDRLNKIDWKNVALSTVIGIITTLSFDAEQGKLVWELVAKAFMRMALIAN
jgi:hypothetical protein